MIRKLLCLSLLLGASALATPKRAATPRLRAAVEVRGGALIPKEGFVKACAWVYGIYGIQFTPASSDRSVFSPEDVKKSDPVALGRFTLMTKKFIEDHFQGPADPLAIFMARGAGVSIMWMAWSLTKLPLETVFLRAAASRAIPRVTRDASQAPRRLQRAHRPRLPLERRVHLQAPRQVPDALRAGGPDGRLLRRRHPRRHVGRRPELKTPRACASARRGRRASPARAGGRRRRTSSRSRPGAAAAGASRRR